ncbi:MAG: GAF domain-containing sensor histidine kinase [Anaerolineae bacterium]
MFYVARPPLQVRRGVMPKTLLAHVEQWETRVEQKLLTSPWKIAEHEDSLWVSQPKEGNEHAIVYSLLLEEHTVVGTVCLVFPSEYRLTSDQRTDFKTLLGALGPTMSLVEELCLLKERLGQLSLFYQVAQSTAATFDLSKVLKDIMQLATAVLNGTASALMLIDEERQEMVFEYAHGEMGNILHKQRAPLNQGIAGWVANNGMPAVVNNVHEDPRFSPLVDTRTGFLTESVICVPLKLRGKIVGVLEVLNKRSKQGFDSEDLNLMTTTANQAAIAIERAQLYQSLRDERDRIIQAQENVRRQVAQNLHDGTVQYLSAISMSIDLLEHLLNYDPEGAQVELQSLRSLTHEATRQARLALFELRPVILETQGLVPALQSYVQQLQRSEEFGTHFETPTSLPELGTAVAATIFSIIQEAVTNVKKHASARDVWLRLSIEEDWLQVIIEDNGKGFDLNAVKQNYDQRGSIGLLSMRERAALIEGRLEIESKTTPPHSGTEVILRVPLPRENTEADKQSIQT